MKFSPVGAGLFHPYGQTDMPKLTVAFRNSANAPKKSNRRVSHFYVLWRKKKVMTTKSHFQPTNLMEKNPP